MTRLKLFLIISCVISAVGCQSMTPRRTVGVDIKALDPIIEKIAPDESAAVSWIYEADSYNITALGNCWRDRIEKALRDHGIRVKGRKDVVFLVDDIESFGTGGSEDDIWKKAGADIIVCGSYRIICEVDRKPEILLHIKALRVKTTDLIASAEWRETLEQDWPKLASETIENVYHKKLDTIVAPENIADRPRLSARLDKPDACYRTGEEGRVYVNTEPGVYIYLFNLMADNSVTLLYPNRFCPEQPIIGKDFVFPPERCSDRIKLEFSPVTPGKKCVESVKVVASRKPLDFSFLPVPLNRMYCGAEGGDIKKVYNVLKQADAWNEVHLPYTIAPGLKE